MNPTSQLHALGQSLWLDNITRDLLSSGTLQRYCEALSVSGLTSNPSIFEQAIRTTAAYDADIAEKTAAGLPSEAVFFELALADLRHAAALFRPIHDASGGLDGWVSLEVSPLLADDAPGTIAEAKRLHGLAQCPNLFIKIPGTAAGVRAIEEAIFAGVPVNVTLLFSREHYIAAADAYWRGVQRRLEAGLDPRVNSVASIFVSRWDAAVAGKTPAALSNRLGVAIGQRIYKAYRKRLSTPAWRKLAAAGALPQRLLWASTGTKDPQIKDSYYVEALAASGTVNTMPEKTLLAFAAHGVIDRVMAEDGGDAEPLLADFALAGVDIVALASQLQQDGARAFSRAWVALLGLIDAKGRATQGETP